MRPDGAMTGKAVDPGFRYDLVTAADTLVGNPWLIVLAVVAVLLIWAAVGALAWRLS